MAADLHIHVFEGITEDDLAKFFSTSLGSKYYNPHAVGDWSADLLRKISSTPSVWVCEVSWLKAALFDDPGTFVPSPAEKIVDLIGEDLPVLDDKLESAILEALRLDNNTNYSLSDQNPIKEFLAKHKGKRLFHISW